MNLKPNILNVLSRRAIYLIFLMLFMSISVSFGGALANTCQGGVDCLVCDQRPHGHVPGAAKDMEKPGCQPGGQYGNCGVEASQDPDEFHVIVSSVRSYNPVNTGSFTATSDAYEPSHVSSEFSPFLLSDSDGTVPIFIKNQSLLL